MKRTKPVVNPSRWERYTLRFMITIGLICMVFFIKELLGTRAEYPVLYWLLVATLIFACLKILHEWIHYFCITVPPTPKLEKEFTVDVFTTFCAGEPYDMIRETLIAIKAIRYPHNTFLCDEADDPYLRNLCEELDVRHVTRTVKINAKAGNINNALKYSSADLCVILDPDHVPFPEFLDPIVSHFNDPDVGFVQIVQSYKNQDQGLIAKGAAQQTYQFYGPIMMTMNRYGTVLAIGANCTFRRAALDSIGGHAAGLAEDMHTAMQLHAKGWKSVYVPAVLARGLVPSTLSAYYSQQLKWSRGVFELLVTSYPKLFSKFTWQQKLHYGVIPMHYLSGLFILLNFLIPICSLVLNTSPINFDFLNFITIGFPLFMSIMLIRLFVQKWVMEEEERGVHIVGGLLMIGTWWVFLTGFFYTLLRKKVPYIPTPKDDSEDDNWHLNIPNLVVIVISLTAIAYGLYNDWNPYNLIMAGFAALNCLILSFSIAASRQFQFRRYKESNRLLKLVMAAIAEFKKVFWIFRRQVYRGIRSTALMLTVLVVCYSIYHINTERTKSQVLTQETVVKNQLVPGLYSSQKGDGLTHAKQVDKFAQQSNLSVGIVSCYIAWGDSSRCNLPIRLLDSIYTNGAIPMITWEPWQSLFHQAAKKDKHDKEKKVFAAIIAGNYDEYLQQFAQQVKSLNRPIFIRFAHEADNPQYPWSTTGENTADEFKQAWRYVHRYFYNIGADNVIWVWNPWKPEAVETYFPGEQYVDWIGLTNLNYGSKNDDGQWYSMRDLYPPFRKHSLFQSGIPVMLAEMGSLPSEGKQTYWFHQAFEDIESMFPEIKAVVFFNTTVDHNVPQAETDTFLNWAITDADSVGESLKKIGRSTHWLSNQPFADVPVQYAEQDLGSSSAYVDLFRSMKGVNYVKAQNWSTNGHPLRRKEIRADFRNMKEIGLNTVKHYGPTIYDENVLRVARQEAMSISYEFWIPDEADFVSANKAVDRFTSQVLKTVKALKDNPAIIMWNIGNGSLDNYNKPDRFYHREAYGQWLQRLIGEIKAIDPSRPVTVDIKADEKLKEDAAWFARNVPNIDGLGLMVADQNLASRRDESESLPLPYFYSKATVSDYLAAHDSGDDVGFFVANWQDERNTGFVTFDGLKDDEGVNKFDWYLLANHLKGTSLPSVLPTVKILLPATTISGKGTATYRVLIREDANWRLLTENDGLTLEWELVRTNRYGDPLEIKKLGRGVNMTVNIPENPHYYRLALNVSNDTQVAIIQSQLHTPLHRSQWPDTAFSVFKLDSWN